ncbi:flagellar brake protein [Calidifontibacillus oryziterrae]|uniref:flagellar brake protein n=1 Tax=Calidifontibacillus oryziterrae TaxID=1191699 RepID=UPI000305F42E|nr:flagellar brake domain-containing protein [Calidifontibacillus oryziterrae]
MLNIGDKIFIELKYSEERQRFKCKVVEKKDNYLFIDYPINEKTGKTAFLLDGTEIKVSFYAKDSAIYMFDSEILARKKANIPMLVINYPGNDKLVRIQRREFVRVDANVDVAVHPLNAEFEAFTTVTADISAGGASIILPPKHQLKPQTEFMCYIVLPLSNGEYFYIKTLSKIIRIINGTGGSRDKAPIQFVDLNETQKQQITRYCFDRQLMDRKKGY